MDAAATDLKAFSSAMPRKSLSPLPAFETASMSLESFSSNPHPYTMRGIVVDLITSVTKETHSSTDLFSSSGLADWSLRTQMSAPHSRSTFFAHSTGSFTTGPMELRRCSGTTRTVSITSIATSGRVGISAANRGDCLSELLRRPRDGLIRDLVDEVLDPFLLCPLR